MLGAEADYGGDGVRGHSVLQLVSQLPGQVVVNIATVMAEDKVAIIAQADEFS